MWPWWILPIYIGLKLIHFVTYPVAVLPFQLDVFREALRTLGAIIGGDKEECRG